MPLTFSPISAILRQAVTPTNSGNPKSKGLGISPGPFFGGAMKLALYCVDPDYCDFLRKTDPCVPTTRDDKAKRPFVGVLISLQNMDYYAPLTSPKPKHRTMKNQLDFLKINDGRWGAINFNNMIPIRPQFLTPVIVAPTPTDTPPETAYKNLLANQLSWCNKNKERIVAQAAKLHRLITTGTARPALVQRCCNFLADEAKCRLYCLDLPAEP
jgi:protein AbiQ